MLRAGGWSLVRAKKHYVYRRRTAAGVQTATAAKTPSDFRSEKNFLATLRRADREDGAQALTDG
jgi:hypothetical protein